MHRKTVTLRDYQWKYSCKFHNTTLKKTKSAYSESGGNSTMSSNFNSFASQVNTMSTIPNRSTSDNTDFSTDQRSVLQHQQLPRPPCSTTNQGEHNFPQCLPCACHDHSHSNVEAIPFRNRPSIHHEVDRNFDSQSSAPLLDDRHHSESHGLCDTSQESRALLRKTQTSTMIARSAASYTPNNRTVDDESAVSVSRSCYKNKAIKTCLIILVVFNIIFLVAIGFMVSMLLNQHNYQKCPRCKEIINQVKSLKGANMNGSAIQDYLKESVKDGRCCLDHAFIFKLIVETNSSPTEPKQDQTKLGDTIIKIIRNAKEKAALHLQSIPFNSELSAGGIPGQTRNSIRWNFKDKTNVGNFWDNIDSDTEIKIPLTGVYYIYAMVQCLYINANSTKRPGSMQTFGEFPQHVELDPDYYA